MEKKITVNICSGTACFVMGSSDILLLEENLPENLRGIVEIQGSTCLGHCKDGTQGKPPFVQINGELMSSASLSAVVARIQELADA
ncbi:MAG: NAD(P)H-dependent oxidoreductase subunit E [Spirochaetes bacterium]|uniref:NAD(P)H-dependent oxidoreductase subunit E n=1 Tax=Candidatus Avitreponema avistercoris TaxID=2840705 RepID=A0A9D9EQG4_9SPIR|nr:NAD(P)H-dependent oxidoreductase subunit E [Candidatus Avitreponema avistercoris]